MNDIDNRLQRSGAKPRRELGADFTTNVLASLDKKAEKRPKWKEYIQVKFHKPAIATAVFAVTLIVGGTAYAAVGGISALFGGQKDVGGGDRVVQVDTQNCPHVNAFNITNKHRSANSSYYYKIKASSKLSNQQVVDMVRGACEADAEGVANGKISQSIWEMPENKNKLVGGYADSVITAISPTSISLRSVIPYGSNKGVENKTIDQTFGRIDPSAVVVASGKIQSINTLKVGDHVAISYRATGDALAHSETIAPDKVDAGAQTVVIVTRVSKYASQYLDYQKYHNREFEEVAPCDATDIGYCTFEEMQDK
jgi:hypothetical protein